MTGILTRSISGNISFHTVTFLVTTEFVFHAGKPEEWEAV